MIATCMGMISAGCWSFFFFFYRSELKREEGNLSRVWIESEFNDTMGKRIQGAERDFMGVGRTCKVGKGEKKVTEKVVGGPGR